MPRRGIVLLLMLASFPLIRPHALPAQTMDSGANLELQELVLNPCAGVLKQGQYGVDLRAYGEGGLLAGVSVGLFQRFMFGVSYGGQNLLGYGKVEGNVLPGVLVKYRLIEESLSLPALTLGYQMQGYGPWDRDAERYLYKAPGAFAALSRNFSSGLGRFGVHAGVNYNTIETKQQQDWDGYFGLDFGFNEQVAVIAEYDLALDDNISGDGFGEGPYGYLNASLRLTFAKSFALQVDAYDLLNTSDRTEGIGRALKIIYVETFGY